MAGVLVDLLHRPVYGMAQVDRLLGLHAGTARRWIDGYSMRGKTYVPVVRRQSTGVEVITWGEFVETRLLAELRFAGVPLINLRPAVDRLRDEYGDYPLAKAQPFAVGREVVRSVQDAVGLDASLQLVVVRNGQLMLSPPARHFYESIDYSDSGDAQRVRPLNGETSVVIDPLRGFGEPVVRNVRTEVIAELRRAGESVRSISDTYELSIDQVDAALRYELVRMQAGEDKAA